MLSDNIAALSLAYAMVLTVLYNCQGPVSWRPTTVK